MLIRQTKEAYAKKQDLLHWLEDNGRQFNPEAISATLLLGREHFAVRVAYMVKNLQELQIKLNEVLGNGKPTDILKKTFPGGKQFQPFFWELGQAILKELRERQDLDAPEYGNKIAALAELYIKGYELDWKAIFTDPKTLRISMPTYPFARERYWLPDSIITTDGTTVTAFAAFGHPDAIHPLLQQNTSDFSEQRFSSTFTGGELFLKRPSGKRRRILPVAAELEMARAAVTAALGGGAAALEEGRSLIRLKNIKWDQPVIVGEKPVHVHIRLFPEENPHLGGDAEIAYEIYSFPSEDGRSTGARRILDPLPG